MSLFYSLLSRLVWRSAAQAGQNIHDSNQKAKGLPTRVELKQAEEEKTAQAIKERNALHNFVKTTGPIHCTRCGIPYLTVLMADEKIPCVPGSTGETV